MGEPVVMQRANECGRVAVEGTRTDTDEPADGLRTAVVLTDAGQQRYAQLSQRQQVRRAEPPEPPGGVEPPRVSHLLVAEDVLGAGRALGGSFVAVCGAEVDTVAGAGEDPRYCLQCVWAALRWRAPRPGNTPLRTRVVGGRA